MDLDELLVGLYAKLEEHSFDPITYQYYNQLLNHRTIILNDDVCDDIVEKVYLPLKAFEEDDSDEPVTLLLNSGGGSVSDGFFLAYYIAHYSKPLNMIVLGYACSMATVVLAGGGKNPNVTRICYPCSYMLIHDGYVALSASESKTAADIMAFNNAVDERIKDFILNNTNISKELYERNSRHQWFIFSEEARDLNLIDKIIE